MAGKGGKCLLAEKTTVAKGSADKDKDKMKAPVSRSSRAGIQLLKWLLDIRWFAWNMGFRMIVSNLGAEEAFSGIS
ncbi:hypothetical protein QYE76_060074 [Lolium multiflorum]|uniref:Uncharacterized protein n=1 Tax=Lolium multiflorum TaxID=4521 RepID=A0AAD8S1G8_LOLMU|nr:hypothetical protein QYE76_060057 [Lolium multiflorum]KAK1642269.1 hypothetical protein QYE76_060074 [Lolium multiflorum]